jgi:Fe-S cluster assembly scaffold protein SufB
VIKGRIPKMVSGGQTGADRAALEWALSRGIGQAMSLAVNGFVNDLVSQFPMEYSVELKRLIDLEMEGSVG